LIFILFALVSASLLPLRWFLFTSCYPWLYSCFASYIRCFPLWNGAKEW